MAIVKMKAIEFNMLNTLLKMLTDKIPTITPSYSIRYRKLDILPAYPRDLTNINKPSIIVRKVDTSQYKVGIDNYIGQYYDSDIHGLIDVKAVCHEMEMQFDVYGDSDTQTLLLTSVITDDIFNDIVLDDTKRGRFDIYDFTGSGSPVAMGKVTILGLPMVSNLPQANNNNDYISVIRIRFEVIQTIVPHQEFVDLSKWMKITQTIKV